MQLEDSNGKVIHQATLQDITDMIAQLGTRIEHCILSDGERYIQTAGKQTSLTVEYRDESGHYEASGTPDAETVQKVFNAYLQNEVAWKTMLPFTRVGDGVDSDASGHHEQTQSSGQSQEIDGPKTVLDAFIRGIKQKANSALGRGVRDILRKLK